VIEHKGLNLCDICGKNYPECDSNVCGMTFGNGTGNDNVISCSWYKSPVGKAMRTAREKYGISQNQLGKLSGIPTTNICFWERGGGNPPIMAIMRIANTLGVTIDELVGVKK